MSVDTLSLLQKQIAEERLTTEVALEIGGHQDLIPTTEHEWLLYNVNNRLRHMRLQPALEPTETAMGPEDAVAKFAWLAEQLKLTERQ